MISFSSTFTVTGSFSLSTDKICEFPVLFSIFTASETSSMATASSKSAVAMASDTFSDALAALMASNEIRKIDIIINPFFIFIFLFSSYYFTNLLFILIDIFII